jgi:hypothetical protein
VLALGAGFDPAKQVTLGDNAEELPVRAYDGNAAYAVIDHQPRDISNRRFRQSRHDVP